MKELLMKKLLLSCLVALALPHAANGITKVNASSTKLTIYGAWLSASGDCSNPVQIASNSAGTEVDIDQSPTLATGQVPPGTYKCLILEMNTVIKFTPATSDGASCAAGTLYQFNTCISSNTVNSSKDPTTGATINCTGTSPADTNGNKVFLYVSRNSLCSGTLSTNPSCNNIYTNAFKPPTAAGDVNNGFLLSSDIVISAATTGNFVFNTDQQIDTNQGVCDLEGFGLSYH